MRVWTQVADIGERKRQWEANVHVPFAVPFSDKDEAKSRGAIWLPEMRFWTFAARSLSDAYMRAQWRSSGGWKAPQLVDEALLRWIRKEDKIPLSVEAHERGLAILRGACVDRAGELYLPAWHWLVDPQVGYGLCYWLPPSCADYKVFRDSADAAQFIAVNAHLPLHALRSDERQVVEEWCARDGADCYLTVDGAGHQFVRYREWDRW